MQVELEYRFSVPRLSGDLHVTRKVGQPHSEIANGQIPLNNSSDFDVAIQFGRRWKDWSLRLQDLGKVCAEYLFDVITDSLLRIAARYLIDREKLVDHLRVYVLREFCCRISCFVYPVFQSQSLHCACEPCSHDSEDEDEEPEQRQREREI